MVSSETFLFRADTYLGAAYAGLAPERRAKYPEELQEVFEDRRWNRLNPVKLLDYEGCELFIMGAHEDLSSK